jgi:hypothetical protein
MSLLGRHLEGKIRKLVYDNKGTKTDIENIVYILESYLKKEIDSIKERPGTRPDPSGD